MFGGVIAPIEATVADLQRHLRQVQQKTLYARARDAGWSHDQAAGIEVDHELIARHRGDDSPEYGSVDAPPAPVLRTYDGYEPTGQGSLW